MHTFFKNGELVFANVATAVSLTNDKEIVNHQIIKYFECPICKLICKITRNICGSHLTRAVVEFALNQVCSLIAGPFRSTCDEIINRSVNRMADLIIKFTDDAAVCKFVHFCGRDVAVIREIEMQPPIEFNVQRKFDCPICKAVVSGIKALVKTDYSQNKIKDALTKVCSKLHKFGSKCQHFVDAYAGKLVGLLANSATRGKVCKLLKLCPAHDSVSTQDIFDNVEIVVEEDIEIVPQSTPQQILDFEFSNVDKKKFDCPICKAVVSGIKALVKSDFSQNKIKDALTKVCSKLHKFGSKCQHFVDAYAGKLVELLTNAATRGKVCRLIKLCAVEVTDEVNSISDTYEVHNGFVKADMEHVPQITGEEAHDFEVADNEISISEPNDVKIGECLLCRGIVKAVKEIVKHSFTKDQVKRALSKACSKVHSNHCQSFVNKHFNQLVDLISNGSKRGKVCKIIRVCSIEVDFEISLQNEQSLRANEEMLVSGVDNREIGSLEMDMDDVTQISLEQLVDFQFSNVDKKKFDCPICKAVVSGIKALVKSDFSQNKIKDALTKVCSKLHKFGSKCQHFVDAYAGKLVELLTNAATRGKVCRLIKLCAVEVTNEINSISEPDEVHKPQITGEEAHDFEVADNEIIIPDPNDVKIGECLLCKGIVKAVKEIVKHSFTKDQVKRALSKACSKVHSNHCQSFVNKHFNQLVDLISNGSKRGKVCKIIRVCSIEFDLENSPQNKQSLDNVQIGSVEVDMDNVPQITLEQFVDFDKKKFDCPICKAVVEKALVNSDFSQKKIKDALTKVCSKSHKLGSNKCQHFVDAYAGKLVELLTNAATRGKVCKLLKLCSSQDNPALTEEEDIFDDVEMVVEDDIMESAPQNTLQQILDNYENTDMQQIFLNKFWAQNYGPEKDDECLICKKIVHLILEEVRRDVTKENIQHVISASEHMCKADKNFWIYCPTLLKIVEQDSVKFASLIENKKTRNKACVILKLCLSGDIDDHNFLEKSTLEPSNVPEKRLSTRKTKICNVCEIIVFTVIKLTKHDPTNKTKIEDALEIFQNWCKIRSEDPACPTYLNILDNYFDKFVILLQDVKTQRKTCNILKLCPGDPEVEPLYPLEFNAIDDVQFGECFICKSVVKIVEQVVKHSRTREHIKKALEETCHKIHNRHCERFVQKHLNQLLELILKATRTDKICRLIKICSIRPQDDYLPELESNIIPVFKEDHDECFLCQATVFGIVQIVKKDFTKDKIRHVLTALKLMCEVHRKDEPDCPKFLNLLKKYFDKLVDLIADEKTRSKACNILKICPTARDGLLNDDLEHTFVANLLEQNNQLVQQSFPQNYEISLCQSCQFAISMMKTFAENPHVVALVHEQLTKLCDLVLVSPQLKNICHNQINLHWISLLNLIRTLQENRICHTVKLCNTPQEKPEKYDVAKVGANICSICQMSLSLMKSFAQNNHFAALVHDTLNNSCKLLISPYMISMCHSEIRTHWLTWLGILRNFQEAEVCRTFRMCKAVQIYGDEAKGERCESCKAISHLVKFMFKMPNFKTRIHVAVNEMCDMLSPSFRSICHAEVKINWQKWMTLLQAIPDEKLCHKVNMCP